jgi:hypothetical protein
MLSLATSGIGARPAQSQLSTDPGTPGIRPPAPTGPLRHGVFIGVSRTPQELGKVLWSGGQGRTSTRSAFPSAARSRRTRPASRLPRRGPGQLQQTVGNRLRTVSDGLISATPKNDAELLAVAEAHATLGKVSAGYTIGEFAIADSRADDYL